MRRWRQHDPVNGLVRVFAVARRGCDKWRGGIPSARARQDAPLTVAIQAAHLRRRATHGGRRLQPELAAAGFTAGRDRIARGRQERGRRGRRRRKFQATTNAHHTLPVAENRPDQPLAPPAPRPVGVTALTAIPTDAGWRYRAGSRTGSPARSWATRWVTGGLGS